jgi:RNA polymerase sigma-70 factor (ECF subfamily)
MSFATGDRHTRVLIRSWAVSKTKPVRFAHDEGTLAAAARQGDEAAFTTLARRYRRELHLHCYRMLASFEDAEDMVQETFLRAWQKRASFLGRASFRAWLYRIATNACLDFLDRHPQRVLEAETPASNERALPHVSWLQPYPDRLLDEAPGRDAEPDARLIAREGIELAFLVALQFLPPRQRAVLVLRDVLDWPAREVAELLDSSVAAVNGALQRARATLRRYQPQRSDRPRAAPSEEERELLERYVAATERSDADTLARLLAEDARFSMPPDAFTATGREAVIRAWIDGGFGSPELGGFRCLVTRANGMPAVACYLRRPGDDRYRPLAIDLLRIENGVVTEVTTFDLEHFLDAFDLPQTL